MTEELKNMLENAARYIIETSARETSTGNWITYPEDMPAGVIPADLFLQHKEQIIEIMLEYDAVAEAEPGSDGSIDVIMYLGYCPNFVPDADERDEYPDDRAILDPLQSMRGPDEAESVPTRPSLAERLEEGKRRAAEHTKPENTHKIYTQGERE